MWGRTLPSEVRSGLFGGKGSVRVVRLLPALPAPFTAAIGCELDPEGDVGVHVQKEFAELVIGIAGRGTLHIGGEAAPIEPGSVASLALGQTLSIRNDSDREPLVYVIVKAG